MTLYAYKDKGGSILVTTIRASRSAALIEMQEQVCPEYWGQLTEIQVRVVEIKGKRGKS